jgi:hypothetical protein
MNVKTLLAAVSSTIVLAALSAPSAKAVDFGTSWDTNCAGGTGPQSCSLQNIVNHITTGPKIDTTQDSGVQTFAAAGNSATSSYLFSVAGYAPKNTFGIYKLGDPNTKIQLFGGVTSGISQGAQTAVSFLADGSVTVGNTLVKNFGSQFGFYLDRQGPSPLTVYSQNTLNDKGAQQVVSYQGNDKTQFNIGGRTQLFDKNTFLLGFEDLRLASSDKDYNDLTVLVSGIQDSTKRVPEPTALLSLAAIGGAMVLRRRQQRTAN